MPLHPLTNLEIQKYYQNEPKFNGVYSINNLPKTNDDTYVVNLDQYKSIETQWRAFYMNDDDVTYFNSCGIDHILNEI